MLSRDQEIKVLRPAIPVVNNQETRPQEVFQNTTLRPVLKLQNELLLSLFKHYAHKRKDVFFQMNAPKQLEYIDHSIRTDQKFKNLLLGTVIGHFTLAEWEIYQQYEPELRRRITDLIIQRLQSQADSIP
jgi:hypothetical protein